MLKVQHPSTPFQTLCTRDDNKKQIHLLSNSRAFLEEALKLIIQYTKKIDPKAPLTFNAIVEKDLNLSVDIHGILPRMVRIFYGFNEINQRSNCHGAALMCVGLIPTAICVETHPFFTNWIAEKMEEISVRAISAGDLVLLSGNELGSHSFVFLSHEICLSMNGRSLPLEIYPTSAVLKIYGHTADALKIPSPEVTVYRRRGNIDYMEPMMARLVEYYAFYDVTASELTVSYENLRIRPLVNPMDDAFSSFMKAAMKNRELDPSTVKAIRSAYWLWRNYVPAGAASRPLNWEEVEIEHRKQTVKWTVIAVIIGIVGLIVVARLLPWKVKLA